MSQHVADAVDRTTSDSTSPDAALVETTDVGEQSARSVSIRIGQVKAGDPAGMTLISIRYFAKLEQVAAGLLRRKGPATPCGGEDIANAALLSIYKSLAEGKFPEIENRKALWNMLYCMVRRKVARRIRDEMRLSRGGGRVRREADLVQLGSDVAFEGLDDLENGDRELSPVAAAIAAETEQRARDALPGNMRPVFDLMLEGRSQHEIAARLGCSQTTVCRGEKLILMTLRKRLGEENGV
jgi:RNA polymerase sigma factor (sigma-70 family)